MFRKIITLSVALLTGGAAFAQIHKMDPTISTLWLLRGLVITSA